MTERPVLFSAPMVRAILAGTKTQTRRVVKPQPEERLHAIWKRFPHQSGCPYGVPGDRLWVRETWAPFEFCYEQRPSDLPRGIKIVYLADQKQRLSGDTYRPSIHMPRWASRLTLEVVSVRVERVQEISEADAIAEGIAVDECNHVVREPHDINWGGAVAEYGTLWNKINGKRAGCAWEDNPWVWVVEFKNRLGLLRDGFSGSPQVIENTADIVSVP